MIRLATLGLLASIRMIGSPLKSCGTALLVIALTFLKRKKSDNDLLAVK